MRIPVKRRPSTRKARQEAIRKSGMEFNFEEENPTGTVKNSPSEEVKNIQNVENNNPTDLSRENTSSQNKDKTEDSLFKKSKKSQKLFDDDDENDDLFDNFVSKTVPKGKKKSL